MRNKSFFMSLCNAFSGFASALQSERNLRIDLVAADLVLLFAYAYGLDRTGYAILILTICAVLMAELFNTSIEKLSDKVNKEYDPKIKAIKDISSAATLVTAIGAVIVGIALFMSDFEKFFMALCNIIFSVKLILVIAITFILGVLFVFVYGNKNKEENRKEKLNDR